MKPRIGILASTKATDLDAVVAATRSKKLNAEIAVLISNKKNAFCLERAQNFGIETVFIDHRTFENREAFDQKVSEELAKRNVRVVVCIGYLRLFSEWFVEKYKNRIVNIHPSLLPAFPGMDLNVHKAVLDAGVKITGCTAHLIDAGMDTGPILLQKAVPVLENDTPESLKKRVQAAEQDILPDAIKIVLENQQSTFSGEAR